MWVLWLQEYTFPVSEETTDGRAMWERSLILSSLHPTYCSNTRPAHFSGLPKSMGRFYFEGFLNIIWNCGCVFEMVVLKQAHIKMGIHYSVKHNICILPVWKTVGPWVVHILFMSWAQQTNWNACQKIKQRQIIVLNMLSGLVIYKPQCREM